MSSKSFYMEIITPEELFYEGQAEMLIVSTYDGEEGFMAGHVWCNKLLADTGIVKIRENAGGDFKIVDIAGGYVDIKDKFVVYTDKASWQKN